MDEIALRDFQPRLQAQTVFKSDADWFYRIPALLYERESETILAFAEQRLSREDISTKNLVMSTGTLKKPERTIEWSEHKVVEEAHIDGHRPMNPCLVYEKNSKTLFLFFICVEGQVSENWQIENNTNKARLCYITSKDLGQTWTVVTDLTDTLCESQNWATLAVGPGHGFQMRSGTLIVPFHAYVIPHSSGCLSCLKSKKREKNSPHAYHLFSEDGGKWQLSKMLQNESIECEMAEFFDEKDNSLIYCNARTRRSYREEAVCGSNNIYTCQPHNDRLVETGQGCQGSVVSFPAQSEDAGETSPDLNKWLLFTHPNDKEKRIHLGVYLNRSPKAPSAWSNPWIINSGHSGYSDLAYLGDGQFACLMECGEQTETEKIASVVFSYSEVKQGIGE